MKKEPPRWLQMRTDNTAPIIAAARRRHELTRARAIQAIRELDHAGSLVTFADHRRPGRDLPVLALLPARHPRRDRAPPGRHQQVRPSADPGQPARLRRLTASPPGSRPRRANPPPGRTHTAPRGEHPAPAAARHRPRRTAAGRDRRLPATVLTRHHPITIRPLMLDPGTVPRTRPGHRPRRARPGQRDHRRPGSR